MKNKILIMLMLLFSLQNVVVFAAEPSIAKTKTFLGSLYNNIKWTKHVPLNTADYGEGEAGSGGQEDIG